MEASPKYYYTTFDSQKIYINEELLHNDKLTIDGSKHYLLKPTPKPRRRLLKGKCYSTSSTDTQCVITTKGKWENTPFSAKNFPLAVIRSKIIHIKGKIPSIEGNKLIYLGEGEGEQLLEPLIINPQSSASIQGVQKAINTLSLIQMQSIYNAF